MPKTNYKYNPADFEGILGLSNELEEFYRLYEKYSIDKVQNNRFALKDQWENLYYTIKAREVEGAINPIKAGEIRSCLEDLLYDD